MTNYLKLILLACFLSSVLLYSAQKKHKNMPNDLSVPVQQKTTSSSESSSVSDYKWDVVARETKPEVYAYWAAWSNKSIPSVKLDGLIVAFAMLKKNGSTYYTDYSKSGNFQTPSNSGPYPIWNNWVKKMSSRGIVSYGGGTDAEIRKLIINANHEQLLEIAGEIKSNVKQYWFDGVDLDIEDWWNYSLEENKKFSDNLAVLVLMLRDSLDSDENTRLKPIYVTVGPASTHSKSTGVYPNSMNSFFENSAVVAAIKAVFLMTYNWGTKNLYGTYEELDKIASQYLDAGVPAHKVFIGVQPYQHWGVEKVATSTETIKKLGVFVKEKGYGGLFLWAIGACGMGGYGCQQRPEVQAEPYLKAMRDGLGLAH